MTFLQKLITLIRIFSNLTFLDIDVIQQLQLLAFTYNCRDKLAPVHFHDYFVPCSQAHRFNTRLASCSSSKKKPFQYGILFIEPTGARLWNMLPVPLRESTSAPVFHAELKNTYHFAILHHNSNGL